MRSAAARRYARALFGLAREAGEVEEIDRQLRTLESLLAENAELHRALLTPLHRARERQGVLRAVSERLGMSPLLRNFLAYLIDQRRLVDHETVCEEYRRLAEEAAGRLRARVTAARALQPDEETRLREVLSRRTGRQVELDVEVEPELIGGMVAKVGDLVFDGSLRAQLGQLRASLTKES